jgi:hypothetical protein
MGSLRVRCNVYRERVLGALKTQLKSSRRLDISSLLYDEERVLCLRRLLHIYRTFTLRKDMFVLSIRAGRCSEL